MTDWADLDAELDRWAEGGRTASLWWRDDDAVHPRPELDRLFAIAEATATPVTLAVIPRDLDGRLARRLETVSLATAVLHGWSHANHAPSDERQEEFGLHRPLPVMLDELARGWRQIAALPRSAPVFVAPWNRMDAHLLPHLPRAGLTGVSTLGPRAAAEPAPGVRRVNVHIDIMDWGARRFGGEDHALAQLIGHLQQRRMGTEDADEPTGLMTHHGFHDEEAWRFIDALLRRTTAHPAARWLETRQAFWPQASDA